MVAATIVITFIVHTIIGIYVNTRAVAIYDDFPQEFWTVDNRKMLTCSVHNRASHSVPGFNPFYTFKVVVVDAEHNEFAYFMGGGNKRLNFTNYVLDLGRIDSGSKDDVNLWFCFDKGNVTFRTEVSLTVYGFPFSASSRTYVVEYQHHDVYTIART